MDNMLYFIAAGANKTLGCHFGGMDVTNKKD